MEIVMCLEATQGDGETSTMLAHVQSWLTNLTMKLQDMAKSKVVCRNVWCTTCHTKDHHRNECHTPGSYTYDMLNPFPIGPQTKWCDICRQWGHISPCFPTL
jgi:hypothetical protein